MKEKLKRFRDVLAYYIDYHALFFVFVLLAVLIGVLTVILVNYSDFRNVPNTIWWLLITLITTEPGYADMYPQNTLGYVIQFLIIILGVGLFGTFIAKLADVFSINTEKRVLGKMKVYYSDHIVICGYSNKTDIIIEQLLNEPKIKKDYRHIVLVADKEKNPYEDKRIDFVSGKIDDEQTLLKAGIKKAKKAIILNEDNEDATTALASLITKRLNTEITVIAEVSDEKNKKYFEAAGVESAVINNTFNSRLLVRTALYADTVEIMNELLTNKKGNEIYIKGVNQADIGQSFIKLFNKYKEEKDVSIIGIKTDSEQDGQGREVLINPREDYIIKKSDEIIYIGVEEIDQNPSLFEKLSYI